MHRDSLSQKSKLILLLHLLRLSATLLHHPLNKISHQVSFWMMKEPVHLLKSSLLQWFFAWFAQRFLSFMELQQDQRRLRLGLVQKSFRLVTSTWRIILLLQKTIHSLISKPNLKVRTIRVKSKKRKETNHPVSSQKTLTLKLTSVSSLLSKSKLKKECPRDNLMFL